LNLISDLIQADPYTVEMKAFQDFYPGEYNHCFGCGSKNEHGHQLKSYWDGEQSVAQFKPESFHIAFPGYVYGGLIASLIDCHGSGTAAAAKFRADGHELGSQSLDRYVTASIKVDYLAPTPIDEILDLRGTVLEVGKRKVIVDVTVSAAGKVCAKGHVIAVKMPDHM